MSQSKKLTVQSLNALRQARRQAAPDAGAIEVIVGTGTCGFAAGAQATMDAFVDELAKNDLKHVRVRQTGCMGLCHSEPTVEVVMPDMPRIVYGRVDAEVARRIVRKHIQNKLLINDHIFDKPAADLLT